MFKPLNKFSALFRYDLISYHRGDLFPKNFTDKIQLSTRRTRRRFDSRSEALIKLSYEFNKMEASLIGRLKQTGTILDTLSAEG